ncbi:DUF5684 domain-containing protein [Microbacterium sp. OR16]|uniref:DUF5684 domain-containing protein n=1 Tax=Microbacterium sp. OR16 TaxID=3095345 RepID=UPI0039B63557
MNALADPRPFETAAGGGMPSAMLVAIAAYLVVGLGLYIWYAIALSKLFTRLGEEGWKGWIPVLNEATILTLGGKPAWNAVLLFIPVVQLYGLYMKIVAVHRIDQRFNRGAGMTVLAVLLPPVWATVLVVGPPPYPEGDRLAGIRPGPLRKPADAPATDAHGYLAPPILPPGSVAPPAPTSAAGSGTATRTADAHPASVVPPLAPPLETAAPAAPAHAPQRGDSAPLIEAVPWTSGQATASAPPPPPPAPAPPAAPAPADAPQTRASARLLHQPPVPSTQPKVTPEAPPAAAPATPPAAAPAIPPIVPPAAAPAIPPASSPAAPPAAPLTRPAPATPADPATDHSPSSDFATADTVDAPPAALRASGAGSPFAPPSDAPAAPPVTRADMVAQVRPVPSLNTPASTVPSGAVAGPATGTQDEDEEFDATVVVSRRRGARRVLVLDDGRRFALSATSIVIGRNPEGQPGEQRLPIPDRTRTLSKTHARLVVQGDEWRLTDLRSTNGVVVVADDGAETLLDPGESVIGAGRFILGEVGMHVAVESGS